MNQDRLGTNIGKTQKKDRLQLLSIRGTYAATAGAAASAPPTDAVRNVTIRGLGFRDGAPTVLEPHGIPSGGGEKMTSLLSVLLTDSRAEQQTDWLAAVLCYALTS